jgi:tetratricopeptide (TPR) repeat protein
VVLTGLLPWVLLAAGGALLGMMVQPAETVSTNLPAWQRPLIAADAVAFYLWKLIAPVSLAPFYGRTPESVLASGVAAWTWIVPLALLGISLFLTRKSALPLVAFVVFILGVGPVLGLITFEFQANSTTADRYLYLSMLAPSLLFAWTLKQRPSRGSYAAATLVVAALGLLATHQVSRWRNTRALFEHSLSVNPESDFAHGNLAQVLASAGENEAALEHFREAVRLRPDDAQNRLNLGSLLGQQGQVDEAMQQLEEAVRLDPQYAFARATLASALASTGRLPRAIEELREATRLDPNFAPAFFQLGHLLEQSEDLAGAESAYRESLRLDPALNSARLYLGSLYSRLGRMPTAVETLREAVSFDPSEAEAQAELGRALLLSNRPGEAVPFLEEALRLRPDLNYLRPMLESARRAAR